MSPVTFAPWMRSTPSRAFKFPLIRPETWAVRHSVSPQILPASPTVNVPSTRMVPSSRPWTTRSPATSRFPRMTVLAATMVAPRISEPGWRRAMNAHLLPVTLHTRLRADRDGVPAFSRPPSPRQRVLVSRHSRPPSPRPPGRGRLHSRRLRRRSAILPGLSGNDHRRILPVVNLQRHERHVVVVTLQAVVRVDGVEDRLID